MAGSPTYTADTRLDNTYGENTELTGVMSIANSTRALVGKGTLFNTELKVGDSISFQNDAGTTVTATIAFIDNNNSATLTADVGGSDVSTSTVITRIIHRCR